MIVERLRRLKLRRPDAAQDVGAITGKDRTYPGCGAAGKSRGGRAGEDAISSEIGPSTARAFVCSRSAECCGSQDAGVGCQLGLLV